MALCMKKCFKVLTTYFSLFFFQLYSNFGHFTDYHKSSNIFKIFFYRRFYSGDSSFVHGGLDKEDKMLEPVRKYLIIFMSNNNNDNLGVFQIFVTFPYQIFTDLNSFFICLFITSPPLYAETVHIDQKGY